ncbi:MAG: SDR family oxidoreductase [Candidatus Thermoplasmatota archaeon]|nr:SDR family oxidoreductase [Candidatus Thermoplasmatota archaeon]
MDRRDAESIIEGNKIALVTGSAKRLGAAIAVHFAKNGYDILVHYNTSKKEAEGVLSIIREMGRNATLIKADLTTELDLFIDEVKNTDLVKKRGGLDVLVNSASKYEKIEFSLVSQEKWDSMHDINSKAPYFIIQGLLNELKMVNGCVINMVDTSYNRPWENYSNYCASKASLYNLTMSLSYELAPEVRVNGIAPGAIMFPDWLDEKDRQEILNQIPMKREGTVEEISETALFLADGPNYITGQIIGVDGGLK